LDRLLSDVRPTHIVNCIALADVDRCEAQRNLALRLNSEVAGEIASWSAGNSARLIHISTDMVFGSSALSVDEMSPVAPCNWYGSTKMFGEQRVLEEDPSALVIRTNFVGWSANSRGLLDFFFGQLKEGNACVGFTDWYFRPIGVPNLASFVSSALDSNWSGVVHAGGARLLSKHDFGCLVAQTFGFSEDLITPVMLKDASFSAIRPACVDLVSRIVPRQQSTHETMMVLRNQLAQAHRDRLQKLLDEDGRKRSG